MPLPPGKYVIQQHFGTFYVICPRCGYDVCWPSWCDCIPQRVMSVEQIDQLRKRSSLPAELTVGQSENVGGSDDASHDTGSDQGRSQTPQDA